MPAGIRLRTAEMNEGLLFLFGGHFGSFARIKADENDVVVAARIETEHAQRADDALLDLIAKHGTAVVDEGEDHRLLLSEIVAELNAAAGLVAETKIQWHLATEAGFESHALQSRRRGRGRGAYVGWNGVCVQRGCRQ